MWALAVGGAGEGLLATGAADATVAVWEDVTAADEEAVAAEEAAVVLKQQDLSNALQVCCAAPDRLTSSILTVTLALAIGVFECSFQRPCYGVRPNDEAVDTFSCFASGVLHIVFW